MPKGKGSGKDERAAELAAFRWALQALAQPADVQPELFSDASAIGQALVDGYNQAVKEYTATCYGKLTPVQRGRLRTLKATLGGLSAEHNQAFWMDPAALASDGRWEQIREQARAVLDSFAWPLERPKAQA